MSVLRRASRVAVASSVHGRVQRRQRDRWASADQTAAVPPPAVPPAASPLALATAVDDTITQLERLGKLRESGVLTDTEFATQKARLLS